MEIIALIYLTGLIPAYLTLRFVLIKLSGSEGRTASDAVLNVLCSLCSWITIIVALVMLGIIAVSEIEHRQTQPS